MIFVCCHFVNDFELYVESSMETLMPWFFALHHTNYACWFPIQLRDLKSLSSAVKNRFISCWVLGKTHNKFPCILIDPSSMSW